MPSLLEGHLVSLAQQAFGYHYLETEADTLYRQMAAGERIGPRFNRRGTEFLAVAKGVASVNGTPLNEGETIRIDTGEIIEIISDQGCDLVSHIIPYRKSLTHFPFAYNPPKSTEEKKISIIIIAKDIECYIAHAIMSCLNQSHSNIEILVVNDNSKDDTQKRVENMMKFDPRITLYNVQLGPNGARRHGLNQATGDYFLIIDGDDWITDDAIERLLSTALAFKSDLVQFGFDHYNDQNRHFWDWIYPSKKSTTHILMPKPIKGKDAWEQARLNHTIWMNFFSARLREYAIKSMRDLYLYEDLPFSLSLMQHAHNPAFCNSVLYHYRRERAGQSTHTWQTVAAAHKQACLKVAVAHTLDQLDQETDYYQLILIYKISQIVNHELHISKGAEAEAWRKLMSELFELFPMKLQNQIIEPSTRQRFRKAHLNAKVKS